MRATPSLRNRLVYTTPLFTSTNRTTQSRLQLKSTSTTTYKRQHSPIVKTRKDFHLSAPRSLSDTPRLSQPSRSTSTITMAASTEDLAEQFEEQASLQAKGKKAKGGGGGGAGGAAKREKDISRGLSRLLRHQALNAGIELDKEGYAPLDKVVSIPLLGAGKCGEIVPRTAHRYTGGFCSAQRNLSSSSRRPGSPQTN